jgi:hypothetical protein
MDEFEWADKVEEITPKSPQSRPARCEAVVVFWPFSAVEGVQPGDNECMSRLVRINSTMAS